VNLQCSALAIQKRPMGKQVRRCTNYSCQPVPNALRLLPAALELASCPRSRKTSIRRNVTLLLVALQTGLRLSELISLDRDAVHLGTGAHVRCVGKGRKERTTPLTTLARRALQAWLKEPVRKGGIALFPIVHGGRLSADSVRSPLAKHVQVAGQSCPSLKSKRVSPHVLRHSAAMELLQAGVDCVVAGS
jgi:site-specific recombinase XerD